MAILTRICFVLMLFGIGDTKEWKPEIYYKGENVTILQTDGKQNLEITFSSCTSKQHVSNLLIYDSRKNLTEGISINRNYAGRITRMKMNNGTLSFLLLNVNFMDSGNYTVSTLEGSLEKREKSIFVPRTVIRVQDGESLIVQFMCNKTNISSIKIEMIKPIPLLIAIYDVEQANCSGYLYTNHIESCALNGNRFSLTMQKVSWLDMGTYVAWDDKRFLLDSIDLDIQDGTMTSSLETTKEYVTVPSTANAIQNDSSSRSHVQGENVNVINGKLQPDKSWRLEVNVSGYSSMLHVTNAMRIDKKKNQHDSGSLNMNYSGQIQMIVINNDSLSFQLLNVSFVENGDIKSLENSCQNRNANILVLRRKLVHQDESGPHVLMCNNTNMSSIKTEIMQTNVSSLMVLCNVTHGNYTIVAHRYAARIQGCVFSGNKFSFVFREGSWLKEATFAFYNDSGFLLDSIFIDVQGSSLETRNVYQTSSPNSVYLQYQHSEKPTLLFVSAVVVAVVAACLAMITFLKIRHRRVPNTETNCIKYRNRGKTSANSSRNLYQNVQEAIPPEDTRMVSAKNNDAVNLTVKANNKGQVKVRLKEDNLYHRRFDYADCSTRTTRNLQIDSTAHLYDYIHENHDRCWSYESNLRSRPNSTRCIAEPCFVYDYVVQHSFMTLRPPAPDPVLTRKTKDRGTRADSISWYKRLNIKSAFRVDPITLYAEINQKTSRESNFAVSSPEAGSRDFINQLAPSSYFELEGIRTTDTMNSPSWLTYGIGPNWRNVENLNSSNFVPRLELSELRADCFASAKSKSRRVAQFSNYDYPRSYFDHPSAMDRRHRRSQSLSDMMAIASVRWSRRRSARACMKKDCYDSL